MENRIINYIVSNNDISPKAIMQGGVQGDNNVTTVVFDLSDMILPENVRIRVDAENGAGEFFASSNLTLKNGCVHFEIPIDITKHGGVASLHLIICEVSESDEANIMYSFPEELNLKAQA